MKKSLAILSSLLLLCTTATLSAAYPHHGRPVCAQPIRHPYAPPAAQPSWQQAPSGCGSCPQPVASSCGSCSEANLQPPSACKQSCQGQLRTPEGLTVQVRNQQLCMLGDQYPLEFDIRATEGNLCDVVVSLQLPEGVSYVHSQPQGYVKGRNLIWDIGAMKAGQCISAKVLLRCECEGELCACFCASATPMACCSILCARPQLTCCKTGPEEVCPGDPVNYTITVTNQGSCAAEEVVVTDNVPDGLEHSSGQRSLTFRLGRLEAGEAKRLNVCFTAVKRGRVCNTAVVTACNAESTSCQVCTCICKCDVQISKTGQKEAVIGKNADYQITVANVGDKPLTDVVVTDCAPASTSIVAAQGAAINGNQAVWKLRTLNPGERVNLGMTLYSCTPGCFTNRVNVTSCQGCSDSADFTTRWRGRPALNMQICDTKDPICIDDTTSYRITVINQGSDADEDVQLVVYFPEELEPIYATGDTGSQISGNTVTFEPRAEFGPRQSISYRIDARAKSSGDARVVAEVTSAAFTTPIVQQESTVVN